MTDVLQPPPGYGDDDIPWPGDIPRFMTLDQYLHWSYECVHAEWVDGELVAMPPVTLDHQRIRMFLGFVLMDHCRGHALGDVLFVPARLLLRSRPSVREPDIMFISAARSDCLREIHVEGPIDLVVEIVMPESDFVDRATKFVEYEAAGTPEYWLVDSLRHEAQFYVLGEDGRYHQRYPEPGGIYHSLVVKGFRLRVDWLWRVPLPTPTTALAELPA